MIHQRSSYAHIVVKRNHLGQDGGIAGLSYISTGTCNEPQRIIIEATADIGVAFLGQRLVLMVSTAVLELGEAISMIRSLARSGIRCTKPSRS